ncbi:TPA_exp: hypothetical protein A8136_2421 [Trichophyton benhamiae CBS 112371]|nr:TPA_exp: hypothetical protein A8136_2421 [Trichophyton benhamiae CBS 112371]
MVLLSALLALSSALTVLSVPGDHLGVIVNNRCNGDVRETLIDSDCYPYEDTTGVNATIPIKCNFYATNNCTEVELFDGGCAVLTELIAKDEKFFKCVSAEN